MIVTSGSGRSHPAFAMIESANPSVNAQPEVPVEAMILFM
jgi:hypothetical protein